MHMCIFVYLYRSVYIFKHFIISLLHPYYTLITPYFNIIAPLLCSYIAPMLHLMDLEASEGAGIVHIYLYLCI
jgi:hypothetical protein